MKIQDINIALQVLVEACPAHHSVELCTFNGKLVRNQIRINGVKVGHYVDPHGRSSWQLSSPVPVEGTRVWRGPKGECRVFAAHGEVMASIEAGKVLDCAEQPVPEKQSEKVSGYGTIKVR
jgi:hypothetical protein